MRLIIRPCNLAGPLLLAQPVTPFITQKLFSLPCNICLAHPSATGMNLLQNKTVGIVGGGPGGLTLARLLQLKGINVKVYERDEHEGARQQGTTLDLHEESGLAALQQAGIMDAFKANYRPGAGKMRITDKHGHIKLDDHEDNSFEEARPEIDRGPLRKILLDSLQPGTVVWNSRFTSMQPLHGGWLLQFAGGASAYADVVIAADGASSKIRPYITPIKPFWAGLTALEGTVYNADTNAPRISALLKGGKIFAFGDEKTIIVSSKGDGSLAFYTSFKSAENWVTESGIDFNNKQQVTNWFNSEFTWWDNIWDELFTNADPHFIPRPQYCMPLNQHWQPQPNLTMLGDAAHLMPPFAGEGVNMAMLDALELSQSLTGDSFGTTQDAIRYYETHMRARASQAAKESLESMEMMHSPGAVTSMVEMFNAFAEGGAGL